MTKTFLDEGKHGAFSPICGVYFLSMVTSHILNDLSFPLHKNASSVFYTFKLNRTMHEPDIVIIFPCVTCI